jgi:hypothetical protein
MECSICLEEIDETKQYSKTLSCGHKLHFYCFKQLMFRSNVFIRCPICRTQNENINKPSDDPFTNVRLLCSSRAGKFRCMCKTKNKKICKRKSSLLNYGMCFQHGSGSLSKEQYSILDDYMYNVVLLMKNGWKTKILLFDLGKQLLIKYKDKIKQVSDILMYFYKYVALNNDGVTLPRTLVNYDKMYDFYEITIPPESWVNFCLERHIYF